MSANTRVLDFILDVSKDPRRLRALARDPDNELKRAGFDDELVAALKSLSSEGTTSRQRGQRIRKLPGRRHQGNKKLLTGKAKRMASAGSLTVVGTGIKALSHITIEAEAHIRQADKVYYLLTDPVIKHWIKGSNPSAESLHRLYGAKKDLSLTYDDIVERLMQATLSGMNVCCALYGHPSVFAYPGREAVRRLQAMGVSATILPAISAEDCLFAALGIDPASSGCQSFEATDFIIRPRRFDVATSLILWQVGFIGVHTRPTQNCNRPGLQILTELLCHHYSPDHEVVIFEAEQIAICKPKIIRTALKSLLEVPITWLSTLYVPPARAPKVDRTFLVPLGLVQTSDGALRSRNG
jgi:precorrin-6B methylase 1